MSRHLNKYIWTLILLVNIPVLTDLFLIEDSYPLKGESRTYDVTELSCSNLLDGSFQASVDEYSRMNFSLRSIAIRTMNQIDFTLFSEPHARSVIVGKEGYLFEENYIKAALGLDDVPRDTIVNRANRLSQLSNYINTPILVVLAPGKGNYFIEHIPTRYYYPIKYRQYEPDRLNYSHDLWASELGDISLGISVLDLHTYYQDIAEVFPKNGTHWSHWVIVDAINKVSDELNKLLPSGIRASYLQIDSTYRSSIMQGTDEDIEEGMNLWFELEDLETTYYKTSWQKTDTIKPKILIVGDSFGWGSVNMAVLSQGYRDSEFWFYNAEVHGPVYQPQGRSGLSPEEIHGITTRTELYSVLSEFDAIICLSTDASLSKFPFGFGD
jgi:hypothetical protein